MKNPIEPLVNDNWNYIVTSLGGKRELTTGEKAEGAVERWREIKNGEDLLRLVLSYCLCGFSLRGVCAWACSVGLADIANTSLLERLGKCENWLKALIARALAYSASKAYQKMSLTGTGGRLIRLVDGTSVCKAGLDAKKTNSLWRAHVVYDLPSERFSYFELTDEKTGERLDMAPVIPGEIRIGDRYYLQPDRIAAVLVAGGDVIVRGVWTNARWIDRHHRLVNVADIMHKHSKSRKIDVSIWIACRSGPILGVRLIAVRKPEEQVIEARKHLIAEALKNKRPVSKDALEATAWFLIVTTLSNEELSADGILALHRLRWRIELAFKRLKSIIGLKVPPNKTKCSAKVWVLAHLLIALVIEPLTSELDDSPRWEIAA
jgi:hypothetical protein